MMSIVVGLVTIVIGVIGMAMRYGQNTGLQLFLKALAAVVPVLLIISGAIAVVAGMSSLSEKTGEPEKKEENK